MVDVSAPSLHSTAYAQGAAAGQRLRSFGWRLLMAVKNVFSQLKAWMQKACLRSRAEKPWEEVCLGQTSKEREVQIDRLCDMQKASLRSRVGKPWEEICLGRTSKEREAQIGRLCDRCRAAGGGVLGADDVQALRILTFRMRYEDRPVVQARYNVLLQRAYPRLAAYDRENLMKSLPEWACVPGCAARPAGTPRSPDIADA
jgi:hypothetical protein